MLPHLPHLEALRLVLPEACLVLGMCAVILAPMLRRGSRRLPVAAALAALLLALAATLLTLPHLGATGRYVAGEVLAVDRFSQFFKLLLLLFTLLVIVQWLGTAVRDTATADIPDFLCLLLGATFGMALMASASHLLSIFLAIESASLPSYALAGFRKRHRVGSEAALKYVLFGAATSAVMVYGMSLLYGVTGSAFLPAIAAQAARGVSPLLALGLLAVFVGLAFKLSAVPMHFWCPDVFEGAPFAVTTFLSVASKGAAICLTLRVLLSFGAALQTLVPGSAGLPGLALGLALVGAVTATWGNLVAYHQNNLKRLLAYSSIAHAGYMLMALSLLPVAGPGRPELRDAIATGTLFYLTVYLFMNLGAFSAAALIARQTGSESLDACVGLGRRCPILAALMTLCLLSLFGMPGLGGFMGKVMLAVAMVHAGRVPGAGFGGYLGAALVVVLFGNTLLSLYYYARPIQRMYLARDDRDAAPFIPRGAGLALLGICAAALLWTGLNPSATLALAGAQARVLVRPEDQAPPAADSAQPDGQASAPLAP
jgi:NADH-quinone oxidoreductase subunit N